MSIIFYADILIQRRHWIKQNILLKLILPLKTTNPKPCIVMLQQCKDVGMGDAVNWRRARCLMGQGVSPDYLRRRS